MLLLYEGLTTFLPPRALAGVRNGADVLLRTLFVALGGRSGVTGFGLVVFAAGAWAVWRDRKRHPGPLAGSVLLAMLAESLVYAVLFGFVVSMLTAALLGHVALAAVPGDALNPLPGRQLVVSSPGGAQDSLPLAAQLVVSLGAGIYEELLFRVLLVSGLLGLGMLLGWRRPIALAVAVAGSALIFSGFHYLGPLGDQFSLPSFTFRAIAGLLLTGLYAARGFGIAAWTHALYDIGLSLLGRF